MEELPLRPVKQAIVTFSLSALLGAGATAGLVLNTRLLTARGASRSAQLRRLDARRECVSLERTLVK
jgi:hypothetical protein